jgi:hypothetical protein
MIPISLNNRTFFFSIKHISKEINTMRIYGISLNSNNYYLSKLTGVNNCKQLDNNPLLHADILKEICEVITEVEKGHQKRPSLEFLNMEIFRILARRRDPMLKLSLTKGNTKHL